MEDISGLRSGQNHAPTATLATVSPPYSGRVTAGFRFIEVPKIEGRRLAGVPKHFCLKAPAIRGVCWLGSSIDPAIEHSE
jgi:hypothetical protein